MTWAIRLLPDVPGPGAARIGDAVLLRPESPRAAGMLGYWDSRLSAEYERERRLVRPPLLVFLPGVGWWCVDSAYSTNGKPDRARASWSVTGEPPRITLSPSVDLPGLYHGWIRDGVISDDVNGRRFA